MGASACFRPGGGSQFEGYRLPDVSRLGSSFSRCAPEPTNPEVYAEHYAARAAACRRFYVGSLQPRTTDHYMRSRGAPSGHLLRPAVAHGDGYSIPAIPGVATSQEFRQNIPSHIWEQCL
jgi:hypothetical protein